MGRIIQLPPDIASQIAAGEVVERPASVVKELIENALDANATKISIRVEDGGKKLIKVTDNGCGMESEDAILAFQRHATSKIRSADDLWKVTTMGFRGEALPSISAVAVVELLTRPLDAEYGTKVVIEGGTLQTLEPTGCPQGTTVTVKKLFFNTPARMKFLKSTQTEFAHIVEVVSRYILSFPEIAFSLEHGDREVLRHVPTGDERSPLSQVLGHELASQLISVQYHEPPYTVGGFISPPTLSKPNRSSQMFFVNRRFVRNKTLLASVSHAYLGFISEGRHPIVILFLDLPPELVDVNVHPAKIEVRFQKEAEIQSVTVRALREVLVSSRIVPIAPLTDSYISTAHPTQPQATQSYQFPTPSQQQRDLTDFRSLLRSRFARTDGETVSAVASQPSQTQVELSQTQPQPIQLQETLSQTQAELFQVSAELPKSAFPFANLQISSQKSLPVPKGTKLLSRPESLTPLKQLSATYILAEDEQGNLFVVCQHRAHERWLFEQLLTRYEWEEVARQGLIVPLTVSLGQKQASFVEANLNQLKRTGFELEPFGHKTFLVRTVPAVIAQRDYEQILRDLIDELMAIGFAEKEDLFYDLLAKIACKSAIKAGEVLSYEEMKRLLNDLLTLNNPVLCPHGQPILIALSKSELDKRFERG